MILSDEAVALAFDSLEKKSRDQSYRDDPVAWAHDVLGLSLWSSQKEILMSLVKHKKTAVKSSHSIGKTFISAVAACWWVSTRENAMVRSTAPTSYQVHELLWEEIRKLHSLGDLVGEVNQKDVWKKPVYGVTSTVGSGQKPSDTNIHSFHGVHRPDGVLTIIDESCHDAETEVLTDRGWVAWPDVTSEDQLLTMNQDTHETEYLLPERLIAYKYTGDMYLYEAKGANFMVTPNHEMLYFTNAVKNLRKKEMQDFTTMENNYMQKVIDWVGEHPDVFTVPAHSRRGQGTPTNIPIRDWATFLGWFASEGSINKALDAVTISQKKLDMRDEIRDLLGKLPYNFFETDNGFTICSVQLAEHLVQYGRTCDVKRLPDYVKKWSPELIGLLIEAFRKGDGYMHRSQGILYTSCKDMADDLHELVLKMGLPSVVRERELTPSYFAKEDRYITPSRSGWVVTVPPKRTNIRLRNESLSRVAYDGVVYCATMPRNNTLFTRRKGYTLWSGNCGVSKALFTAADAISTGKHDRVLAVGNPDDPQTPFGDIFLKPTQKLDGSEMWNKITISAFDTPNFTGEKVPDVVKESLIQKDWVEERKQEWGEESGRYRSKILAEFPDQSDNSFFAQRVIDTGIDANIPEDYENPLKLGVDIAGGGEDETVIYGNRGGRIRKIDSWPEGDAVYTANRILEVATRLGAKEIRIDAVGFGAAVVDIIKKDPRHANFVIAAVKGSFMPKNNAAHANARAEHYDAFRFGLSTGSIDLDPHDTDLKDELLGIQYQLNAKGAIQIESKREVRKRGGKSPDNLDAAIYSYIDISELFEEEEQGLHSMSAADFLEMLPAWANLPW